MFNDFDWGTSSTASLSLDKVRVTVLIFLITSVLAIIFGISELTVLLVLWRPSKTDTLLYFIDDVNDTCLFLMKGASITYIVLGLFAILIHFLGYPERLLCALSILMICPFGFTVVGIGEAASIKLNNQEMAKKMMAMDVNYYKYRHSIIQLPMSEDKTLLVSKFQKHFHCCGMFTPNDWLLSTSPCLPLSCCKPKKKDECSSKFINEVIPLEMREWKNGSHPLIRDHACNTEIQEAIRKLKRKLLFITGTSILIHCGFFIFHFHSALLLQCIVLTSAGKLQLRVFQGVNPIRRMNKVRKEYKDLAKESPEFDDMSDEDEDSLYLRSVRDQDQPRLESFSSNTSDQQSDNVEPSKPESETLTS